MVHDPAVIIGISALPVGEHWELSLPTMAGRAVRAALKNAGNVKPDVVYIGNALGSVLSHQANLGALVSEMAGIIGVEGVTVEASGASGAAAFRAACIAVCSGWVDVAVAVGVEKVTDCEGSRVAEAANLALNYEYESSQGLGFFGQSALIAQRYLHQHQLTRDVFAEVAWNDFSCAKTNSNAMFRGVTEKMVRQQAIATDPFGFLEMAFLADGAAAAVVTRESLALQFPLAMRPVMVSGSANAIAPLSIHDRHDLLFYSASSQSAAGALRKAGLRLSDIGQFDISDATVIDTVLALEAMGVCAVGKGWQVDGLRLNQSGGCLGRGNPMGATGLYQVVEMAERLQSEGDQPKHVLVQTLGGAGATVITHILSS